MNEMTIPAHDVQAGDYLETTYGNGRSGGSLGIGYVTRHNDTVTLHGAMAAYDYPAAALVTITR